MYAGTGAIHTMLFDEIPKEWVLWLIYGSYFLIIFSVVFHALKDVPLFNHRTSIVLAVCFAIIAGFGVDVLMVKIVAVVYGAIGVYIALGLGFLVLSFIFAMFTYRRGR